MSKDNSNTAINTDKPTAKRPVSATKGTTQPRKKAPKTQASQPAVRRYLAAHPDFFVNNDDLLPELTIPHPVGGAVSLLEHQVHLLRSSNQSLKKRMQLHVELARENERLNDRMRELCLALFQHNKLNDRLDVLSKHLHDDINADAVTVRLYCPKTRQAGSGLPRELLIDPETQRFTETFQTFLKGKQPLCGRLKNAQKDTLFGDQAEQIQSAVLTHLGSYANQDPIGLLAIGSYSADRFQPDMGTDFLTHLGELAGQALGVCMPKTRAKTGPE